MSFKIGSWNVRGFNDPQKQKNVKSFLKNEGIRFFGLLETKVKSDKYNAIFGKIFEGWDNCSNHQWSPLGRICIFWDPEFCKVNPISSSDQYVFCEVQLLDINKTIFVNFIYVDNRYLLRRRLWEVREGFEVNWKRKSGFKGAVR